MLLPLKRYADFSGRSGRHEFWWHSLFLAVGMIGIPIIAALLAPAARGEVSAIVGGIAWLAFFFGNFIPGLALSVRRFHDLGVSGHFLWLVYGGMLFFSILAWFAYLVVMSLPGKRHANQYGPPVYDEDLAGVFG